MESHREEIERKRRAFEKEVEEEEKTVQQKMKEAAQEARHRMKDSIEQRVEWEEDWGSSPMVEILENMEFPPNMKSLTPVYEYEAESNPSIQRKVGQEPALASTDMTDESTSRNIPKPVNEEEERTGLDPVLEEAEYAMDFILQMVSMACPNPSTLDVEAQCDLKPCGERVTEGTITNIQQKLHNPPPYVLRKIEVPAAAEGTTYDQWCRDPRLLYQAAPSSYEDCYKI